MDLFFSISFGLDISRDITQVEEICPGNSFNLGVKRHILISLIYFCLTSFSVDETIRNHTLNTAD